MRLPTEVIAAGLVTLAGIALTVSGVFAHVGAAVAPGALLTLVGGGWLGNSLARHDVPLLPGSRIADGESAETSGVAKS